MNYYKYIGFLGDIKFYGVLDVPDKDVSKYFKTIPVKVLESIDDDFIENQTYNLDMDRLKLIKDIKIIKRLDKLLVFK